MKQTTASLITIGDELLIGQVIDTNSAWMAQQLNSIGIIVKRRVAVGDIWDDIWQALDGESKQSQIILITGGLGPTADDITKPLLCEYFDGKMIVNGDALQNVKDIFTRLNRPLIERNLKQAEVPDTCRVIQNKRGTAPGMWFEKNDCIYVSMPGVPYEMRGMMADYVLHELKARFTLPHIVHKTLLTANVGESMLADLIQEWEETLPANIKLAYLPNFGMVRLRLTAVGPNKEELETDVNRQFETLQQLVKEYLVTNKDEPMEAVVARLLKERGKTVSTAESCTGGYIAHLITSVPGSSAYYWGSVVSYDNSVKQNELSVDAKTLETDGAVSETVVRQMITGVLAKIKTDYAIAVSGILGPDGGTPEKPVGTVWVAAGDNEAIITQKFHFRFDRRRNMELASTNALNLLRKFILSES